LFKLFLCDCLIWINI